MWGSSTAAGWETGWLDATSLQTPGSPRKSLSDCRKTSRQFPATRATDQPHGYPFALSVSLFASAGTPFVSESLSLRQGPAIIAQHLLDCSPPGAGQRKGISLRSNSSTVGPVR